MTIKEEISGWIQTQQIPFGWIDLVDKFAMNGTFLESLINDLLQEKKIICINSHKNEHPLYLPNNLS